MKDEPGCVAVIVLLFVCGIAAMGVYDLGYHSGRRDAECRAAFVLAPTASDSLAISRKDMRCADMLTEAPR